MCDGAPGGGGGSSGVWGGVVVGTRRELGWDHDGGSTNPDLFPGNELPPPPFGEALGASRLEVALNPPRSPLLGGRLCNRWRGLRGKGGAQNREAVRERVGRYGGLGGILRAQTLCRNATQLGVGRGLAECVGPLESSISGCSENVQEVAFHLST